jgi:hypothetical protein
MVSAARKMQPYRSQDGPSVLTNEQKICRIKSFQNALRALLTLADGRETSRKELFLDYPHTMTLGVGWQTDVFHKLETEGILRKGSNGTWYVKSGQAATRLLARQSIGRILGFGYVEEFSVAPEKVSVPGPVVAHEEALPDVSREIEPVDDGDRQEGVPMFQSEDAPELPAALVDNIEYIRDGVDMILEELSKPAKSVDASPPATQPQFSPDRASSIEQGLATLQKDVAALSRLVKMALSQVIGEDK